MNTSTLKKSLLSLCCTALVTTVLVSPASAADSPAKLRSEIAKVERQYISLYNKLNSTPEFAIACRMEAPTGSNFEVRVCQPRYQLNSQARSASEVVQFAQSAGDNTGAGVANGPSAGTAPDREQVDHADKDAAYRQHALAVQAANPELRALAERRGELQVRLDALGKGKGQ